MVRVCTVALSALLTSIPQESISQTSEYELGQIVVARKALMFDLQTAYWTLLKVRNGEGLDYQAAGEAAHVMSAIMAEFLPLMKPGTAHSQAPGSRAKPEVWTEPEAFAAAANDFQSQADALAEVAESGNPEVYADAFDTFAAACTACHGLRPSSDGRFRYAKDE